METSTVRYRSRRSAIENTAEVGVTDAGLAVGDAVWPWERVHAVHLAYYDNRAIPNRFGCAITGPDGATVELMSHSYEGIASFADQRPEYLAFVRAIHDRLAGRAGEVQFTAGSIVAWVMSAVVLVGTWIAAVGVIYACWSVGFWTPKLLVLGLLPIVATLRLLPVVLWRRPTRYTPQALPAGFVP